MSLAGTGSANAKTVSASENFYTGALTESDTCNPSAGTIASVAPANGISPVTFTVTPRAPGNCSITISDTNSQSALVSINVAGAIVLSPSSLSFIAAGSANARTTMASQSNYSGTFTASTAAAGQTNSCSGTATISPATSSASFTVTPVAAGHCIFTITGGNGQTATLTIDVTTSSIGGS